MANHIVLHILDNDISSRTALARLAFSAGHHAEIYANTQEFLTHAPTKGLVLVHDDNTGKSVLKLISEMTEQGQWLPVVAVSEAPRTAAVVSAIKAGALNFMHTPRDAQALNDAIMPAAQEGEIMRERRLRAVDARNRINRLTWREREVLQNLAEGKSNKEIARVLQISPRTVEIHRANMMGKLGLRHAAEAVRIDFDAAALQAA